MGGIGNIGSVVPPAGGIQGGQAASGSKKPEKGLSVTKESQLSQEEQQQVQQLRQRDMEVRQHEQAHLATAGRYAKGGASYTYTTGPDGKRYATGGEVSIDTGPASKPEETIRKMEVVKRAAMAPADPSAQDRAVFSAAAKTEMDAQKQAAVDRRKESEDDSGKEPPGNKPQGTLRGIEPSGDPSESTVTPSPSPQPTSPLPQSIASAAVPPQTAPSLDVRA